MIWLVSAVVLVALVMLVYLLLIQGATRYKPLRWWVLAGGFAWGAVGAVAIAVIGNAVGHGIMSWSLDAHAESEKVMGATASFVAPLVEELAKGLCVLALLVFSRYRSRELAGPLDGVVIGGIIGLGFSFTEDIGYVASAGHAAGGPAFLQVFVMRSLAFGLGHATYTAMTGLGFGIAAIARSTAVRWLAPMVGLALAMALHFGRNFSLTYLEAHDGAALALGLMWLTNLLFIALIGGLAFYDRKIIRQGLAGEVDGLLTFPEYQHITNWKMTLPFWSFFRLQANPGGYLAARRKQVALIRLAFLRFTDEQGSNSLAGRYLPPPIQSLQGQTLALASAPTADDGRIVITDADLAGVDSITITAVDLAPPPKLAVAAPNQYWVQAQTATGQQLHLSAAELHEQQLIYEIQSATQSGVYLV